MAIGNTLAELAVKILADTSGLSQGLGDAEKQTASFSESFQKHSKAIGGSMVVAGAAITGAMTAAVVGFTDAASKLKDMSGQSGLTTDILQELGYAAKMTGSDVSDIGNAMKFLQKNTDAAMEALKSGSETGGEAFKRLGINVEELKALTPDQQFMTMATALAGVTDEGERTALALQVFGKGGSALLPMLADGATGLTDFMAKARELGIVMGTDAVESGDKFGDSLDTLNSQLGAVGAVIATTLLPVLQPLLDDLSKAIVAVGQWAKENPELTKVLIIAAAALGLLLTVVGGFILLAPGILAAGAIMGTGFTVALGPIGLIILAIAALIAIGVLIVQNWDWIAEQAQNIWGGIANFFKGVWNALVSGFEWYINTYIDGINMVISLINSIPGIDIGMIGRMDLSGIKAYAEGGIVPGTGPQLAMVHGGETIIPAGGGGAQTIQLFIDGEQVSNVVEKRLYDRLRYQEIQSY